jgi:hypothetical protein
MKMIIDIPEGMLEAIKEGYWSGSHKLELAIRNGIPYEEQPALNNISESDKQKLIESINKSRPQVIDSSAECPWIPVTYRPMTEEEVKEACEKWGVKEESLDEVDKRIFTCPLPDDGQEILVSHGKYVQEDICSWDEDFCGLEFYGDWDGVDAWMPSLNRIRKKVRNDKQRGY